MVEGEPMKGSWLTCYWITTGNRWGPLGFGVTAFTVEDAITLVKTEGFDIPQGLAGVQIQENVTFADLDQNHVVPNMGPMVMRGVWYPRRNLYQPRVR
jgi:hypothetical protein